MNIVYLAFRKMIEVFSDLNDYKTYLNQHVLKYTF